MARVLLDAGADPSVEMQGLRAIDFARSNGHDDIVARIDSLGS